MALLLRRLQDLADRWSREAAAASIPDLVPGRPDMKIAVAAADANRLDRCADELRVVLAGGDDLAKNPDAPRPAWRVLTAAELEVVGLLMSDAQYACESMAPIEVTYGEPAEIAQTVYGWLRGIRDTGKVQVKSDHGHLPDQGAGQPPLRPVRLDVRLACSSSDCP